MAEKAYIYTIAANGLQVRIPADKYPQWKKVQDELRAGGMQADLQIVAQLHSLMERT